MKTFCTEVKSHDGLYDGPIVTAETWEEAVDLAPQHGANVVGEFGYSADMCGNVLLVGTAILGESTHANCLGRLFP
jgi:hypothetical protein